MAAIACPEPEQIAAAISGTLALDARGDVLDHTAVCTSCHALLIALESETQFANGSTLDGDPGWPASRTLPAIGDRIGRYDLVALLGSGGMGVVYRARDTELARDVALKLLRPGRPADRLRREAQLLARLDAPNIVAVHDVGEHAGAAYIVMELVEGESMRGYLATPRAADDILAVCLRAGEGLAAAHRAGVVHRDFKPDNVLVAPDGSVHVGDFGLADAARGEPGGGELHQELTATGAVLGTPAYMAPEQIDGEATAASDQYAFCVTVWEALTGKRPIDAPTVDALFAAIRTREIGAPARPLRARIERALRRGLSRDPAARFPDLPALLAALAPPRRRGAWIAGGGAVLAAAAAAVTTFAARVDDSCPLPGQRPRPAELAALERTFGADLRAEAEAAFAAWETARTSACRSRDRARLACLALIAARGRSVLPTLTANPTLDPDLAALDVDRGFARCLATPPPLAPALVVFDIEATRVATLLQREPKVAARALPRLAQLAEAVGEPAIVQARWLLARSAADRGDHAAVFELLPQLVAAADKLRDDELRARASALHADVLGRAGRTVEGRVALEQARAGWARVGRSDELALGRAEIAILAAESQFARAAELAEQLVGVTRARYPAAPVRVGEALMRASSLWSAAGDYARAARLQDEQIRVAQSGPAPALTDAERASLETNMTTLAVAGEHRAALRVAANNLAITQRLDADGGKQVTALATSIAYLLSQLAQTHELLAESAEALIWYRNLRAFLDDPRMPPAEALRLRVEALEGEARHLNRLGRPAEAIAPAREALVLIEPSTIPEVREAKLSTTLQLARALFATGVLGEARALLEASHPQARNAMPYTRGVAAGYLAYVLWETGDERDRGRARALAGDAAKDFEAARVVIEGTASLRQLAPLLRREIETLAHWRATRD